MDVLKRIRTEADEFVDIDEIIDFFTRKGRPVQVLNRNRRKIQNAQKERIDSYMKDQASDFSSPDENDLKEKRKLRKQSKFSGKSAADIIMQQNKEQRKKNKVLSEKKFGAQFKGEDDEIKVTVPKCN